MRPPPQTEVSEMRRLTRIASTLAVGIMWMIAWFAPGIVQGKPFRATSNPTSRTAWSQRIVRGIDDWKADWSSYRPGQFGQQVKTVSAEEAAIFRKTRRSLKAKPSSNSATPPMTTAASHAVPASPAARRAADPCGEACGPSTCGYQCGDPGPARRRTGRLPSDEHEFYAGVQGFKGRPTWAGTATSAFITA